MVAPSRFNAEVKGYMVRDVVVPALSSLPVRAPFFPDWWQVRVTLGNSLPGILKIYPSANQPSSPHRITGTGEAQFPGRDKEQIILLENTSGFAMPLSVCASLGTPPTSVVNPVAPRNYAVQDVTIGAGATTPVSVSFFPDWWEVRVHPDSPTDGVVLISPSSAPGVAPLQIIGTGEAQFPGQPGEQSISIQNTGSLAVNLSIVASQGYPPTAVVNPVTAARLLTAAIQAQGRFEANRGGQTNWSFTYLNAGRYVLVMTGMQDYIAANPHHTITSVVVGGVTAVPIVVRGQATSTTGWSYAGGYLADLGSYLTGNITITITYNAALNAAPYGGNVYANLFSWSPGMRSGNSNANGLTGVGSYSLALTGQAAASLTFALCIGDNNPASETTGATVVDTPHVFGSGNGRVGMWSKLGAGSLTFTFSDAGAGESAAVAVEMLPT